MNIISFRVKNFRSIIDSGWVPFSPDGITVLVGQNESGKSSLLDALHITFSGNDPTEDDFRIGAELPSIHLKSEMKYSDFGNRLKEFHPPFQTAIESFLREVNNTFEWVVNFKRNSEGDAVADYNIISKSLPGILSSASAALKEATENPSESSPPPTPAQAKAPATESLKDLTPELFAYQVWLVLPLSVLFNEVTGRLPNQIDIDEKGVPTGDGKDAAESFLEIANVNLADLVKSDQRTRENVLKKANAKVSSDFNSFWSQTIGKSGKLELKCTIQHYGDNVPAKIGKPYLIFWICDGNTQLYPMQRSQGVRWFVSFYLQLKASEKKGLRRVFLLDEPGANLHSKAQTDVLKLINQLGKDKSTVVYSTHSPQMLEYPKLFRVHAVQRSGDDDESPTVVIDAHRLGTATSDTLSPILAAMGVDLSHQQVIRKSNNVILEEMSGYYYLTSFWKLTNTQQEVHFIAATGVNKIQTLSNMFVGWGLDFIVAVDDDNQGREALKLIRKDMFGDDDELASKKLIKLPNCPGIEDAFSEKDFQRFVLADPDANITGANSEYLKTSGRSKPVLAFQFALSVNEGKVKWDDFDQITRDKITTIISALTMRLKPH